MDGFDFFRRFLGIPRGGHGFKSPIWEEEEYDEEDELDDFGFGPHNSGPNENPVFGFRVFSGDPFDMHRDFERQFDEVMRNFMRIMGSGRQDLPELPELPFNGGTTQPPQEYIKPGDDHPRNRFLKPSFEKSNPHTSRADSDLDGRITGQEIDDLFKQPSQQLEPRGQITIPSFFGQSSFSKTIHGPDGRVEHHKTFKSSDGTEQTVVTRQFGDQSYSVTVKKNKDGSTERTEDFVNMNEDDLNKFDQLWGGPERKNFSVPALVPPSTGGGSSWADLFFNIFK
ncbi:hypothetical protein GE061_005598 [Apolygus lucorum]|uniref:HCLS1-associated protein X-1 n=1 Tax=Apolygus lucorum TaxID=248454 RepID=A0A8S9WYI1_APOLU|nr:hypothetical protein GE061_005598 [Apolygus lucorum]